MGKILAFVALIAIILVAGFFYLNQKGNKSLLPTPSGQVQPLTSQNVDSTLDQQTTAVDSTMSQVDQNLKELDQTNQSESDLQGI